MKVVTIKKRDVARELTKGYIRLLTQQATKGVKAVDDYFFDEDEEGVRPFFYGSIAFGIAVALLMLFIT
ncbi:hypothetical protein [Ureibacillus sp. FSL E2-3493]|uniref:hypothetical protein n=1 Tax=Ureibacillus sp. FSL E2-3493 TaxID=2921367 RepID=UPI00311A22C2